MAQIRIAADRLIHAPAEKVYSYIADYREHHPRFLPPECSDYHVEQGGVGTGTVVRFRMTVGRRSRVYRQQVVEPEPGRVLTESDLSSSAVTTFTVSPEGDHSRVQIVTTWKGASGVGGFFERIFAPRALRRLYADELERLDRYAQQQSSS